MMKVVFICLLSVCVCLGKPADDPVKDLPAAPTVAPTTVPPADPKAKPSEVPHEAPANATAIVPAHPNATEPTPTTPVTTTDGSPNKTVPKKDDKEPKGDKSKDEKQKLPAKDDKATTTVKPLPITEKAATSTVKPDWTTKNATTTTTIAPHKAADDDKHTLGARGFDGASFIGGIILTLGLLAIGFMGFKYYKNQSERNYRTL